MDDEFGDAGLKIVQGNLVKLRPFLRGNRGSYGDGVVEDEVSGSQAGLQIRVVGKPIPRDEHRQLEFVGETQNDFEEIFAIFVEVILVGVEMGGTNAHGVGAVDLRAKLKLNLAWVDFWRSVPVVMEVAVLVDEARNFIFRSDRAPAVIDALTGQRNVKTEVEIGMRLGVIGNLREPGARNNNACGVDEAGVESLDGCRVHGMGDANVVGVDDQELGVAGKAEPFGESLAGVLGVRAGSLRRQTRNAGKQAQKCCEQSREMDGHREDFRLRDAGSPVMVCDCSFQLLANFGRNIPVCLACAANFSPNSWERKDSPRRAFQ